MKPTTLRSLRQVSVRHCQRPVKVQVVVAALLGLLSLPSVADDQQGCVAPYYYINPLYAVKTIDGVGFCYKYVWNPTPSLCSGPSSQFVCWHFKISGTLSSFYTFPATPCDGSRSDWVPSGSAAVDIDQAYNNDTTCPG